MTKQNFKKISATKVDYLNGSCIIKVVRIAKKISEETGIIMQFQNKEFVLPMTRKVIEIGSDELELKLNDFLYELISNFKIFEENNGNTEKSFISETKEIVQAYILSAKELIDLEKKQLKQTIKDEAPVVGGKQKVLIVDDAPDVLPLLKEIVESMNFKPIVAGKGSDAIKLLKGDSDIKILLTDIFMPEINGFNLAKEAKNINPEIGIVYMSGYCDSLNAAELMKKDEKLLRKPFKISALSKAFTHTLEHKQAV